MTTDTPTSAPCAARSMGHIAIHYGKPEDGPIAAKLLTLLGFTETQMLPLPNGNFYRFVVDNRHFKRGDGILYLSALPEAQLKLIETIHSALKLGTEDEHEAVRDMRQMLVTDPEASFHLGFLVDSLDDLERMVLDVRAAADNDPAFKGRVNIVMNRARIGNKDVDDRLDKSPVFGDVKRYAYGSNGVQVFFETDLLKGGQLGDSLMLEFDYVFPNYDQHILSVVEL